MTEREYAEHKSLRSLHAGAVEGLKFKDARIAELEERVVELTRQLNETGGIAACMRLNAKLTDERDELAAALEYEKARVVSLELAIENQVAKVNELACAWEAVQANCVAGSVDPRPGVARSSIIRIGEICAEQDYRPRLVARLAAERKAGAVEVWESLVRNIEADSVFWRDLHNLEFAKAWADEVKNGEQIESGEEK